MMPFMLSCEEVRFEAGADPRHRSWRQRLHLVMCSACRHYVQAMQALDLRLESTLRSVSGRTEAPLPYDSPESPASRKPPE
jgi:hypothetical protein